MIGSALVKFYTGYQMLVPASMSNWAIYPIFATVAALINRNISDGRFRYIGAGKFELVNSDAEDLSPEGDRKIGEMEGILSTLPMMGYAAMAVYVGVLPRLLSITIASCIIILIPLSMRILGNVTVKVVEP